MNERIVKCEACDGEGRIYERHQYYCRHTGYHDGDVDMGPCPYCDGTGGEIIETQPIEMTDLDAALEADGEKLRQLTGEDHGPFDLETGVFTPHSPPGATG